MESQYSAVVGNPIETLSNPCSARANTIWKFVTTVMTKRKKLMGEFSTQDFSQNKCCQACHKQCSWPGKPSVNDSNASWVQITLQNHAFELKNRCFFSKLLDFFQNACFKFIT